MRRPPVPVAVVAGVLAAIVLGGALTGGDALPVGAAAPAPVVGAVAVCPDLRQEAGVVETAVSAAVATTVPTGGGTVTGSPLGGAPEPLPLSAPGQSVAGLGTGVDEDAYVLTAEGLLSGGLSAQQVTRAGGPERGLSGVRCEAPRTSAWFVGGSTAVGDETTLVLVNPEETAALVDVTVFTADGPAERRPGRGIAVRPRGRTIVPLDRIAPGRGLLAVHVEAQRGRVASALRHVRREGSIPRGAEWVPRAPEPATGLVVPGVPSGPGERGVLLANPGEDDTTVEIEVTTGDGQFVPTGLEDVTVPAGTTVLQDLSEVLRTAPAAVRVTSRGAPVLASGLVADGDDGTVGELAYAGAVDEPLQGSAVLPDVTVGGAGSATLLLSALTGDGAVDLTPISMAGQAAAPAPRRVEVPGGRTVGVLLSSLLPDGATGRFALQVEPVEGTSPLHAARYLSGSGSAGPLVTSLTLVATVEEVPRPAVVRDPLVGVSGGSPRE